MSQASKTSSRGRRPPERPTRERILEAAAEIFASRGFRHATVRAICRQAGANVAAVNYYFRGKLGLYKAVLHTMIAIMEQARAGQVPGRGQAPARERLEAYYLLRLRSLYGEGKMTWIHQLLAQENVDPTPAFGLLIERVYKPGWMELAEIVADCMQMPCADPRVQIATGNALGASVIHLPSHIRARLGQHWTEEQRDAVARALAAYAWAGMRALAAGPQVALDNV